MTTNNTHIAKNLRKNLTDAEKLLWRKLRAKQIEGLRFRRQQPIGNYIVDFVCFEKLVVLEVDGGQHAEAADQDRKRDEWLKNQGFTVLRFWNNQVLRNIAGVMQEIDTFLGSPSPNPSHQGRGIKLEDSHQGKRILIDTLIDEGND